MKLLIDLSPEIHKYVIDHFEPNNLIIEVRRGNTKSYINLARYFQYEILNAIKNGTKMEDKE